MNELAFVGDIHGELVALNALVQELLLLPNVQLVFLGDHVNKGPDSAGVLEALINLDALADVTLLRGNHEDALLRAIDDRNMGPFLKMGGASTVRSYLGRPARADVLGDFVDAIPPSHINALRRMSTSYETEAVVARHTPGSDDRGRFTISGHVPAGIVPRITPNAAHIDTGCGDIGGRLSAFLWPTRNVIQADSSGAIFTF